MTLLSGMRLPSLVRNRKYPDRHVYIWSRYCSLTVLILVFLFIIFFLLWFLFVRMYDVKVHCVFRERVCLSSDSPEKTSFVTD